jgi:hypothetical protein
MNSIGKAATVSILIAILVLLTAEAARACGIQCTAAAPWQCEFSCTPDPAPPGAFGIGGIQALRLWKAGAHITSMTPPRPMTPGMPRRDWAFRPEGNRSEIFMVIRDLPIAQSGRWCFTFASQDPQNDPVNSFQWSTLDTRRNQVETGFITINNSVSCPLTRY